MVQTMQIHQHHNNTTQNMHHRHGELGVKGCCEVGLDRVMEVKG